jgi:hypothetical protein
MREREWPGGLKEGKLVGGGGENIGAREIATLERDRNTHAHSHTCSKALPPGAVNVKNIHSSPSKFLRHPYHCSCCRLLHTHTPQQKHTQEIHTHVTTMSRPHTHTHTHTHTPHTHTHTHSLSLKHMRQPCHAHTHTHSAVCTRIILECV